MVTVMDFAIRQTKDGREFVALILQGGLYLAKSKQTNNYYATVKQCNIGTYRFLKETEFNNWRWIELNNGKTWWGGEPAGDLLTGYLRPAELTLYTNETRNELMKNYRLIPDEKGNVIVYKKFWQNEEENDNFVPPLLVYADLINSDDSRCQETGVMVYKKFLQNNFL